MGLRPAVIACAAAFSLAVPASAQARTSEDGRRGCELLFGDEETRLQNEERRLVSLVGVERGANGVDVLHEVSSWSEPRVVSVRGIELLSVRPPTSDEVAAMDGEPPALVADVALDASLRGLCPARHRVVRVDDDLMPGIRVLSILKEGLLLEHNKNLAFLPAPEREPPSFRMIWRSSYLIIYNDNSAAPPAKKAPPKRPARRRR